MKARIYNCLGDTGRDFVSFQFISFYRAKSKANFDDAKRLYRKYHGTSISIVDTWLGSYEGGKLYE